MSIFKRKINKNAVSTPRVVRGYIPSCMGIAGIDGAAFSNIDRIASEFASLNYGIYRKKDKQKVTNHSLYDLLKQPSLDERHFNFFYQSAVDYYSGKGCFWLIRRYNGEVVSLFRLNPDAVTIRRNDYSNRREFVYYGSVFTSNDVLYIPARFGYSSILGGKSIFNAVPGAFKTSENLELFAQNSYKNGTDGKRIVVDITDVSDNLTDEQIEELKANFNAEYAGVQNAGKALFRKKGFNFSEIGTGSADNRAAELADNRKLQKEIVNNIFQMPSENFETEKYFTFLNEFAIKPLAISFQEAINSLLDEDVYYFEFDYNGVMKVSLSARVDSYTKQIANGTMSPNEARAKENLPPIEAGDNHFMPVNLMPLNDETIEAYMAKQKLALNPTDPDAQHFAGGDDKQ